MQQVASPPESLLYLDSPSLSALGTEEGAGAGALFLHVGALSHGMLVPCPSSPASLRAPVLVFPQAGAPAALTMSC